MFSYATVTGRAKLKKGLLAAIGVPCSDTALETYVNEFHKKDKVRNSTSVSSQNLR